MKYFARYALSVGAVALFAGCGTSQTPLIAPAASSDNRDALPYHKTFRYTATEQSFKVPAGVTWVDVDVRGAAGAGYYALYHGGRGGRVMATIAVHPGQTLHVFVGGEGFKYHGGFNGGGNGGTRAYFCDYGWGGGGASDVRARGDMLQDRILVAGGGGGSGTDFNGSGPNGGGGGGKTGVNGTSQISGGGGGGEGGKQRKGGAGGKGGGGNGHHGTPGHLGAGGGGGVCAGSHYLGGSGGGGGGGYFGGGGGGGGAGLSAGDGAGGGSGYVESSAIKSRMWRGWKTATGNGLIVFSWL